MKTAIATVSIAGSLKEKIYAISRAGFDGFEIFENDLIASNLSPRDVSAIAQDYGLSIDLYQPFRDFEGVTEIQLIRNLERAKHKFEVMNDLGVNTILVCSNVATATENSDQLFIEQLGKLADLAQQFNVKVAYEALAWGKFVSTYDKAWDLVKRTDHPSLGVCLDSFHILSRGTDLDTIAEIPGNKIFSLQLADAPALSLDVLSWSRHHRLFPGEGSWNIAEFVNRVLLTGFSGPLSLEIFNDLYRQSSPSSTALDGHRSLTFLQDEVAKLSQDSLRPKVADATIQPLANPEEILFAELSPGENDDFEKLLKALGFSFHGRHQRKAARLWTSGQARVIVNPRNISEHPKLSAIALGYDEPESVTKRLGQLQYQMVSRDRQDREVDFGVVESPSNIEFHIGSTCNQSHAWLDEFTLGRSIIAQESTIESIDHIAVSETAQHSSESTLFLRAGLGLMIQPELDLPSEYGLVRSRSATNEARTVRLALNLQPVHRGTVSAGTHIAFASKDIFKTAQSALHAGLKMLPIPTNYYQDLKHRFALEESFVEELSSHNLLYDCDSTGAFLHFYTSQLGGVFVEVVQRLGSYDGYGAYNAFVRLSAQRAQDSQSVVVAG